MPDSEQSIFNRLKHEVAEKHLQNHSPSSKDISKWKGQDIVDFQEDLLVNVKANVSEKWFYTYFKSPYDKLPRIDMLNMLSIYVGYKNWTDYRKNYLHQLKEVELTNTQTPSVAPIAETPFKPPISEEAAHTQTPVTNAATEPLPGAHTAEQPIEPLIATIAEKEKQEAKEKEKKEKEKKKIDWRKNYLLFSIALIILLLTIILVSVIGSKKEYSFCFVDSDRNAPIKTPVEIEVKSKWQSPTFYQTDSMGCFKYETKDDSIQLTVKSPLHENRELNIKYDGKPRIIELSTDESAQMLYYYSVPNPKSKNYDDKYWERKRKELNQIISDNATIYQVLDDSNYGVDVLTKDQYISKLTLPTETLQKLQIIEIKKDKNGKFVKIKFKIVDNNAKK